jgi:hypothetical protein
MRRASISSRPPCTRRRATSCRAGCVTPPPRTRRSVCSGCAVSARRLEPLPWRALTARHGDLHHHVHGIGEHDQDLSLGAIAEDPQVYISVRLTLNASTDLGDSPILESYQLKATPNPHIQRNVRFPLWLQDIESDSRGQKVGYKGSAYARLNALETLENDQSVVQVYDRTSGESFSGTDHEGVLRAEDSSREEPGQLRRGCHAGRAQALGRITRRTPVAPSG